MTQLTIAVAVRDADAKESPARFQIGAEIGGGLLEYEQESSRNDFRLYLAFKGGFRPTERLLLGIEFSGFTIQGGNLWDPAKGAGISQYYLMAQYQFHPVDPDWYLKGGGGYVTYWDNRPNSVEDDGWGGILGIGRNWRVSNFGSLGPLLLFSIGESDRVEHRAIALLMNWSYP